jgi:hypothetical protein
VNIVRIVRFDQVHKNDKQVGPILWPVVMRDFGDSIGIGNSNLGVRIRKTSKKKLANSLLNLNKRSMLIACRVFFRLNMLVPTSSGGSGPTNFSFLDDQWVSMYCLRVTAAS